jgi:hypothetical protein
MAPGYRFLPQPNDVASVVLAKSTWAVLALTCHIELFHAGALPRRASSRIRNLSDLFKDVLLFHWKEESQHAILDEMEWQRENGNLSAAERDRAVNDLIELVAAVDGILQVQSAADVDYFVGYLRARVLRPVRVDRLRAGMLKAYRWQYIVSGVQEPRFTEVLGGMITPEQLQRIGRRWRPSLEMRTVIRAPRGVDTAGTCHTCRAVTAWAGARAVIAGPFGSDPREPPPGQTPNDLHRVIGDGWGASSTHFLFYFRGLSRGRCRVAPCAYAIRRSRNFSPRT